MCRDPGILFWSDASKGSIPDFAVAANVKKHGERIYVARTRPDTPLTGFKNAYGTVIKIDKNFKGPMLGKLHPSHNTMYLAHGGLEFFVSHYQVLCAYIPPSVKCFVESPYTWVPASNGFLPSNSFVGGKTEKGKDTYVARVKVGDHYETGYVVPSERKCHYLGDQELSTDSYEVLVPTYSNHFSWCYEPGDSAKLFSVDRDKYGETYTSIGRTRPGFKGLQSHSHSNIHEILKQSDQTTRVIGSVKLYSDDLHVSYKDSMMIFSEYEALVVSAVPNSLQEFCRYAILKWTCGVPSRIAKLPLPAKMKEFCQFRKEEKSRTQQQHQDSWDYY